MWASSGVLLILGYHVRDLCMWHLWAVLTLGVDRSVRVDYQDDAFYFDLYQDLAFLFLFQWTHIELVIVAQVQLCRSVSCIFQRDLNSYANHAIFACHATSNN